MASIRMRLTSWYVLAMFVLLMTLCAVRTKKGPMRTQQGVVRTAMADVG